MAASLSFWLADIKVRIRPFKDAHYTVGNTKSDFIHIFGNIMEGRNTEQKADLSRRIITRLKAMFPEVPIISINIREFERAAELDPSYAPAYAGIADSWILLSLYANMNPVRAIDRAMPMIEKALALDPESSEAFAALGLAVAPGGYAGTTRGRKALEGVRKYLKEQPAPSAHHRAMVLWAATHVDGLLSERERQKILEELGGDQANAKARIHAARGELLGLLEKMRARRADHSR